MPLQRPAQALQQRPAALVVHRLKYPAQFGQLDGMAIIAVM
jgi:hypothetical protein